MKSVKINKKARVEAPAEDQAAGIIAFQVVEFVISYLGCEVITSHDTKILSNGRQFVIGGCGFIGDGYEVVA